MGDILELDPAKMKLMTLDDLKGVMKRLGLITASIDSVGKAVKALIEKGVIEV